MVQKQIVINNHIVNIYQSELINNSNTLVFLHGWGQSGKCFEKIFHILDSKNISYISFDLPGFGKTPLISNTWQIENYGDFIIKCIEKLELKHPTLIGHSFGGRITIYIASFYRNISRIVLIGSAGIRSKQNPFQLSIVKVGKLIFSLPILNTFYEKIRNKVASEDNKNAGNLRQIFINTISNDLRKYMDLITIPSLLIRGDRDNQTPLSEGEIIHTHIKNSRLEVIQKGTHFVYDEFPSDVEKFIVN